MKFNQVAKDYSAGWKMRVNTFAAVESRCTRETYSGWSRSASLLSASPCFISVFG